MSKILKEYSNTNAEKLAIFGGPKLIKKKFKGFNTYNDKELKAGNSVLKTGILSGFIAEKTNNFYGGYHVRKLEKKFTEYFKCKFAITVNSWTSGLVCAVGALNICPGDEIIVTPWTMSATSTAILAWGGIPVFSEIDLNTYCLDPEKIENKITKKSRAIIVADIFGQSADYKMIMKLAKKYNLKVISDSAQAIGSKHFKDFTGTNADIGGYSLNRHKHIHTGEGGVIITNNKKLADIMFKIRNHGECINEDKNFRNLLGFNFRMGEVEAAVGYEQLKKLNQIIKKKQNTANLLTKHLKKLDGLKTPFVSKNNTHVYYIYPLQIDDDKIASKKNFICNALRAEGVPIEDQYVNLLDYTIYTNPNINKYFPWSISKNKKFYSRSNNMYKQINNLQKKNYLGIEFCSYDFEKKDIILIVKAFQKVWNSIKK